MKTEVTWLFRSSAEPNRGKARKPSQNLHISVLAILGLGISNGCHSPGKATLPADAADRPGDSPIGDASLVVDEAQVNSEDRPAPDHEVGAVSEVGTRVRTDAFDGWIGGTCNINADCEGSPAARGIADYRCPRQIFCLAGLCHAECIEVCTLVRLDLNPCPAPRFCVGFANSGGMSQCRISPLKCTSDLDCPLLPPIATDGGNVKWACEDGICRFPGFEYPTQ